MCVWREGGVYNGYYRMKYSSEKAAEKATASLKGSFGAGALAAAASGTLEGNIDSSEDNSRSLKSTETGFQATGWNAKRSPQVHIWHTLCTIAMSLNHWNVRSCEVNNSILFPPRSLGLCLACYFRRDHKSRLQPRLRASEHTDSRLRPSQSGSGDSYDHSPRVVKTCSTMQHITSNDSYLATWRGVHQRHERAAGMQAVVDLDSLIASANEIEVDDGERLEAVLCEYTDIEDYRKALREFQVGGGKSVTPAVSVRPCGAKCCTFCLTILRVFPSMTLEIVIQEDKFNIIAQALSQEFLCFSYYERVLAEALSAPDCSAAFHQEAQRLQLAAQKQKVSIRDNFGTGVAALGNWEKVGTTPSLTPSTNTYRS